MADSVRSRDTAALEQQVASLRARLPRYPLTFLGVIMIVGAIDFADRSVLAVVFEDIKEEFGVSDTALGSLVAAYTVVATLSVIPCGILADRWRRVWLIALGFLPWAFAMFWQGAATSFAMLFVARIFLGSIEATNGPSSLSLVGDWYPFERRSRIMGIWRTFELLGTAIGAGLAGVIATAMGWRAPFFVFGALGLLSAAVVLRVLEEPERGIPDALHEAEQRLARARGETTDFEAEPTRCLQPPRWTTGACRGVSPQAASHAHPPRGSWRSRRRSDSSRPPGSRRGSPRSFGVFTA